MARLAVSAVVGIAVGIVTLNPVTGFQAFAAVSAVDPPLTPAEPVAVADCSTEQQEPDVAA